MRHKGILAALAVLAMLGGCASQYKADKALPVDQQAYSIMADASEKLASRDYAINPDDVLKVDVFFEPALSVESARVDRSGNISLPAIGTVQAEGLTGPQLASAIADRLRGNLLRDPRVSVSVVSSARQKVVVTGQVRSPGVYDIRQDTTLVEALALASGETDVAKLDDVVVYRTIDGQRMAAAFDVGAIMSGTQPNLKIESNDMVVVGYSANRAFWRDFRQTIPIFALFRPFVN